MDLRSREYSELTSWYFIKPYAVLLKEALLDLGCRGWSWDNSVSFTKEEALNLLLVDRPVGQVRIITQDEVPPHTYKKLRCRVTFSYPEGAGGKKFEVRGVGLDEKLKGIEIFGQDTMVGLGHDKVNPRKTNV